MQPSATAADPSLTPRTFAGLLADFAAPEEKFPPARDIDGLADDIATLSYEHALKTHARYRPAPAPPEQLAAAGAPGASSPSLFVESECKETAGARAAIFDDAARQPQERKNASVTVRLSHAENEQLRQRAAEAGLTVSAYLRSCAFEVDSLRTQVKQTLAELRQENRAPAHSSFWSRFRGWKTRTAARPGS